MYAQKHHSGYFPVAEGIARKTLVHGKNPSLRNLC